MWIFGGLARLTVGRPAIDPDRFIWIHLDLGGISVIQELRCPVACGSLWRSVAACGGLWQAAAGPYTIPCSVLGAGRLAGWWLAGWLDGWMATGILAISPVGGKLLIQGGKEAYNQQDYKLPRFTFSQMPSRTSHWRPQGSWQYAQWVVNC